MSKPLFEGYVGVSSWTTGGTTKTVSVTVNNGDRLVIVGLTESDGRTIGTPTGGGLTYSLAGSIVGVASRGNAYVWTATATSAQTFTMSATANGGAWGFGVYRFSASDGFGAVNTANADTSAPQVALTTTADNSAIVAVLVDWNAADGTTRTWRTINGITPSAGNGLEKVYERLGAADTNYSAYWDDAGAVGAKTVGMTAPNQQYSIVAIEVLGTATAGVSASATMSQSTALAAAGSVGKNASSSLSSTATLTATGVAGKNASSSLSSAATLTATSRVGREVLWTQNIVPGNTDPVEPGGITTGTGVLFGAHPGQPYVAALWSADGHFVSSISAFGSAVGDLATIYAWAHNASITSVAPGYGTMGQAVFISGADALPNTALNNNYWVSPVYDDVNGRVLGIRFWTSLTRSGNYRVSLFRLDPGTQATGVRVASKAFTSADIAAGQWQTILFDTPYVLGAPTASGSLSSTVTLTSSGSSGATGAASFAATASLTAQGLVDRRSDAVLAASPALAADAVRGTTSGGPLPLAVGISAGSSVEVQRSSAMSMAVAMSAVGGINVFIPPQPPADLDLRAQHQVALKSEHEVRLRWLP